MVSESKGKKWRFDRRLLKASLELYVVEEYLELIEKQIDHARKSAKVILDDELSELMKRNLTPEDPDWHIVHENYDYEVEVLYPRILCGPFLVLLYAVYESVVTEVSHFIQKKQKQAISLDDIRGDFLERAQKYYKHILRFELLNNNMAWQRIRMLSTLRNAIAHANGRLAMVSEGSRKQLRNWEKQNIGIQERNGYIIVDAEFLRKTFTLVHDSLRDLVARYEEWDDMSSTA